MAMHRGNQDADILGDIRRMRERMGGIYGDGLFSQTYGGRFYGDGGLTPPVGAWAGPGDKLLAAVCRVEDEGFNMTAIRPKLLQAINRMRNDGRQIFDCRLGPGGIYHPGEVRQ